ncbi:MAG: hypothetical protein ACI3VR_00580 [Intestinibacter sp.]|uniref:hypothetical protein n=1 Tax=Intestinibacter sp. TaxID=1965304 RepID=UPI003F15EB38
MNKDIYIGADYYIVHDGERIDVGGEVDITLADGTEIKGVILTDVRDSDFSIEVLGQEIEIEIDKVEEIS